VSERIVVVRNWEALETLRLYLEDKDYIAFDTETTGLSKEDTIIGYSICADPEVAFYVCLAFWDAKKGSLIDTELLKGSSTKFFLSSLVGKSLVMHNATFDCMMVDNNYGIDLMPSVHTDTMILAHLLDENRRVGLKELATAIYGEDSRKEQLEMKESVYANGGVLTQDKYELYKADSELMAHYGAKDAILTLKLFYHLVPQLYEQRLDKFFYEEESMPLLRGPTYDLNRTGLRVDTAKLEKLRQELSAECLEAKAFILKETWPSVKDKYPGTGKTNHFNIGANKQLSWLLYDKLGNDFHSLTDEGRVVCDALSIKIPYYPAAKRAWIATIKANKDRVYKPAKINPKTGKLGRPGKVGDPWNYIACGKEALGKLKGKYRWVEKLLEYKKAEKILTTYVEGIQKGTQYGIIHPSFLQHGTKSGRYSSRLPNFQNLPRDDKRVKACIISRPGKVFVGADYSQLEPRVFASFSRDERLLKCFSDGDDFYSVVGAYVFGKTDCTLKKDDSPNSFPVKYKKLRDLSKVIALATPYGTTAPQMSREIELKVGRVTSMNEAQEIIDDYFTSYPSVKRLMLDSHEAAKRDGAVYNLFGRPRRLPEARLIPAVYGKTSHGKLPKAARNILNMAMNTPIQSTGASLINRAAIRFKQLCKELYSEYPLLKDVALVMQVHDELIAECREEVADIVAAIMKTAMEDTNELPGVALIANPVIASNLADLK